MDLSNSKLMFNLPLYKIYHHHIIHKMKTDSIILFVKVLTISKI